LIVGSVLSVRNDCSVCCAVETGRVAVVAVDRPAFYTLVVRRLWLIW